MIEVVAFLWKKAMRRVLGHTSSWKDNAMPRQATLDAPGVLHHVMARGLEL